MSGRVPPAPDDAEAGDGYRILSAPAGQLDDIAGRFPDHAIGGRQDYARHYIDMSGSFDDYMAQFSGKTRSTLRRKQRKLAEECGGAYELREYRTPGEVARFLEQALPLSAMTYQARLLDAGLPETPEAHAELLALAEQDRLRCYLLGKGDEALAYLALPVEGETLVYAWLGYHPEWARLSPGTVLQLEALERVFAEERYAYFDFTEGEGAHKAMFGTGSVDCASFLLLRKTLANRALMGARGSFDAAIVGAKAIAARTGAEALLRKALRA